MTQIQLARALRLSGNSLISHIESGYVSPTADILNAIAEFFDQHRQTSTSFMIASKLNLLWSLPRKLKRGRQAKNA